MSEPAPILEIATRPLNKEEMAIFNKLQKILAGHKITTGMQVLTLALFQGLNHSSHDDASFMTGIEAIANAMMQLRSGELTDAQNMH